MVRMPELAEVEFFRRQWDPGIGHLIKQVRLHPGARIFREVNVDQLTEVLTGSTLLSSEAQAKQMLFRFSGNVWLGLHLGMTGRLRVESSGYCPGKADHFVLDQDGRTLVFADFRMFGCLQLSVGKETPEWWARLPPPVLSDEFTEEALGAFCARRARSPIKAVLLMQQRFPGIGNWMADEILWRAGIHPACPAGRLTTGDKRSGLYHSIREVAADALREIAGVGGGHAPVRGISDPLPDDWLFNYRWKDGGRCPVTEGLLVRDSIGGRTTCYSPQKQTWGAP